LHTSGCTYTSPNSLRTIAPVGHASRQPALVQCLHTSDIIIQREAAGAARSICSTNATCRHVVDDKRDVLS